MQRRAHGADGGRWDLAAEQEVCSQELREGQRSQGCGEPSWWAVRTGWEGGQRRRGEWHWLRCRGAGEGSTQTVPLLPTDAAGKMLEVEKCGCFPPLPWLAW